MVKSHFFFTDAITVVTSCYKLRKKLLYKHNRELAETQDCLARCYAMIGQFKILNGNVCLYVVVLMFRFILSQGTAPPTRLHQAKPRNSMLMCPV